jgi:hypothetical protein
MAGRGDSAPFDYGAPTGNGGDGSGAGVILHWIFDEAGAPIVDEVAALSLASVGAGNAYQEALADEYALLTPGVQFNGAEHYSANVTTEADLETDDFVVEAVVNADAGVGDSYIIGFFASATLRGYSLQINRANPNKATFILRATDDTTATATYTLTSNDFDNGDTKKVRMTGDRDGDLEIFVDGVSQGTTSIATLDGKNINPEHVNIGSLADAGSNHWVGNMFELRITKGNMTNNSGGTGGG